MATIMIKLQGSGRFLKMVQDGLKTSKHHTGKEGSYSADELP
jgi:hypothetical protein